LLAFIDSAEVKHIPVLVILSKALFRTPVRLIRGVNVDNLGAALAYVLKVVAIVSRSTLCVGVANVFVSLVCHVVAISGCCSCVFEYSPCEAEKVRFGIAKEKHYKPASGYPGEMTDTLLFS
jgi:hypothetical protein